MNFEIPMRDRRVSRELRVAASRTASSRIETSQWSSFCAQRFSKADPGSHHCVGVRISWEMESIRDGEKCDECGEGLIICGGFVIGERGNVERAGCVRAICVFGRSGSQGSLRA